MFAKSVTLSLIVLAASASFASAAQMNNQVPNAPIARTVSLDCSAGHGDVAQTLYIKNTTNGSIASGTKIYWTLYSLKGSFVLQSALGTGKTVSELAAPGNGGTCKAYFLAK